MGKKFLTYCEKGSYIMLTFSFKEVVQLLRISPATINRYLAEGTVKPKKSNIGGTVKYTFTAEEIKRIKAIYLEKSWGR